MLADLKGKVVVVKMGGAAMVESKHLPEMLSALETLHQAGVHLVIVHGGGPEISKYCALLNLPVQFAGGQRVTDAPTLELAQMVLCGKINRNIVSAFNQKGLRAVGISGQDANFVLAEKLLGNGGADLGFVGRAIKIDTGLIKILMQANYLPVIAPIATSESGQAYNINGDLMAGAIAGALGAEALIMLTDVNGFYQDIKDPSSRVPELSKNQVQAMLNEGEVEGGMVPKLQACVDALNHGVKSARLLQGEKLQAFLMDTNKDIGTVII